MPERLNTTELLAVALGERAEGDLAAEDVRALTMIRSTIETIRLDATDPVPQAVLERAHSLASELPTPPSWFDRAVAVVLAPLVDDRPQLAFGLRGDDLRQCTFAANDLRLDLEVEVEISDETSGDEATRVRGQIDAEQSINSPVEVAVLIGGTERLVTSTTTEADGRFDLLLPPGDYEFAFRIDDSTQTIGRIEIP